MLWVGEGEKGGKEIKEEEVGSLPLSMVLENTEDATIINNNSN